MNRQKVTLLILLLLFVIAVFYAYRSKPEQKKVAQLKNISGKPAEARKQETVKQDQNKLKIDLLDTNMPRFSGFKRNIFRLASLEVKKVLPPPPPPLPPPPPPPPPPTPSQIAYNEMASEMSKFTFLGFLLKDSRKTVFLSTNREIFVVKKGDKIANKYEVTTITDNVITIHSTTGGGEIAIPLIENRPLTAPKK